MKNKLDLLYEDDDLLFVNKPPGLLSIPDRYGRELDNLYQQLNKHFGKVYIVHRLDKETSGILCFGKHEDAHRQLSYQFEHRTVDKYYYTLVEGRMHQEEGRIEKPIAPSPNMSGKMIVSAKGKPSLTLFKVIEYFRNFTLVEANIKTGRTHQIRVHFDAFGYPLAVDPMYSRRTAFFLSEIKRKYRSGKEKEERALMTRSTLHAQRLSLDHPTTGERMHVEAPLPKDFKAVLNQLRKWGKE